MTLDPSMKRRLAVVVLGLLVLAGCAGWLLVSQLLGPDPADPTVDSQGQAVSAAAKTWS